MVDDDVEHEAIELRFGERIGALELDRVLGGEHVERLVEHVRAPLDGDAVFLHRLEQGRLRFRRRAVDFVGQHDVAEDGSGRKDHLAPAGRRVFLNEVGAGDVGRHQVGRELDARELQIQHARERLDEQRFREARNADDKAVAADEERQQDELHDLVLADNHLLQLRDNLFAARVHAVGHRDVIDRFEIHGALLEIHQRPFRWNYELRIMN